MHKTDLNSLHHCVFNLNYHLIFVTKYRPQAINNQMLERLKEIFIATVEKWECELVEFNGAADDGSGTVAVLELAQAFIKAAREGLKKLGDLKSFYARSSPDGKRIAFIMGKFPESAIYLANADGSNVVKLTK